MSLYRDIQQTTIWGLKSSECHMLTWQSPEGAISNFLKAPERLTEATGKEPEGSSKKLYPNIFMPTFYEKWRVDLVMRIFVKSVNQCHCRKMDCLGTGEYSFYFRRSDVGEAFTAHPTSLNETWAALPEEPEDIFKELLRRLEREKILASLAWWFCHKGSLFY